MATGSCLLAGQCDNGAPAVGGPRILLRDTLSMHINRGLLFWGLALVTAGVVALAAAQGWIDIPIMADLWNFWPVILIVVGLAIVLSRTPFAVIGVIVAALVVGFAGGAVIAAGPGFGDLRRGAGLAGHRQRRVHHPHRQRRAWT